MTAEQQLRALAEDATVSVHMQLVAWYIDLYMVDVYRPYGVDRVRTVDTVDAVDTIDLVCKLTQLIMTELT